jgi:broad specificity phosphatase PhoE
MASTKIIFIRHGETEENARGEIAGLRDGTLTDKGRKQAAALAKLLVSEQVKAIYSSDLKRALLTAQIASMAAQAGAVTADARLSEADKSGKAGAAWRAVLAEGVPAEVEERLKDFIAYVEAVHPGETVAAFTHFGPMFTALRVFAATKPKKAARRLKNGAVIIYQNGEVR